jgi:hypothetical protein
MRTLLCLAFFGLFAQMATAQMLEVNSPTSINLRCTINVPPIGEATSPTIYIFGEHGLGFVSKDKCKSWKQLDIDPVQKRTINLAAKVNDSLIFISGGKENDLLKYSTDNGATFKDFPFKEFDPSGKLNAFPICAIIPMNNWYFSIVAFMQINQFAIWEDARSVNSGLPIQQSYFGGPNDAFTYLGGNKDGNYIITYARAIGHGTNGDHPVFGVGIVKLKEPGYAFDVYTGSSNNDSITSVALNSDNGNFLVAFYIQDRPGLGQVESRNYEVFSSVNDINNFTNFRYLPELAKEQSIKSSLITKSHSLFWHVGGDINGKNGFIIKDGAIIKRIQSSGLNLIIDVSDSNNPDAILAIGNNGKIYSTRTDLALATPDAAISCIKADDFSAYPNPFNSELTVKSSSDVIATLSDVLGSTLKQIRLESGDNRISLVGLKPGIYFLTNKQQTLKLIKQ